MFVSHHSIFKSIMLLVCISVILINVEGGTIRLHILIPQAGQLVFNTTPFSPKNVTTNCFVTNEGVKSTARNQRC